MSLKEDLAERVRGLALNEVDIIFVKDRYLYDRIIHMSFQGVTKPIRVVMVKEFDDMKALSHVDMRALGWVRIEKTKQEIEK